MRKGLFRELFVELTGIELTWAELVALSNYNKTFENSRNFLPSDYVMAFAQDYFGLDFIELGFQLDIHKSNKEDPHNPIMYGMNLLGNKKFKKYCQENVQFWREQRDLI